MLPLVSASMAGDGLVFVSHMVTLEAPAGAVAQRLRGMFEGAGFREAACGAIAEQQPVYLRAGVGPIAKRVEIARLADYPRGPAIVFPFRWSATGPAGDLFPVLDANLEVIPEPSPGSDDARTRLRLTGSYTPPLGPVGRVLDHVVLHHVASQTTRAFVVRLARQLVPATHPAINDADVVDLGSECDNPNPATP